MKLIKYCESEKELLEFLNKVEFTEVDKIKYREDYGFIVKPSENILFSDPEIRGRNRFFLSHIRVNYINWEGRNVAEYLAWDDYECDFYRIEDKGIINKIETFIKECGEEIHNVDK